MAVDYYLNLDGVDGESEVPEYENQIQLLSWNWGASQKSSVEANGGSGAGKVNLGDIAVSSYFDKSRPKFFKNICEGKHFKSATLSAVKSGAAQKKPYLKVDLGEVFVTSIQLSAASDKSDIPVEIPTINLSFSYNEITIEYGMQKKDGSIVSTGAVSYSLKENKADK